MDGEIGGLIVRSLRENDCDRLVDMDQRITGRGRKTWFEGKLQRALGDSDVRISLGAELDGRLVGALLGSVHYGEFGLPEPVAILDTILVDNRFSRKGIASAMFRQLLRNAKALKVEFLRTELGFEEQQLTHFLEKQGFKQAPRKVLELSLSAMSAVSEDESEMQTDSRTPESGSLS